MKLRMSPRQYSLLKESFEGKKPVLVAPELGQHSARRRPEELPENQVEKLITDWLRYRGWVCTKQHSGSFVRKLPRGGWTAFTFGETGQADWRCERPIIPRGARASSDSAFPVELFYLETKAPGQKPTQVQALWLSRRQLTGITATWADSFEGFVTWYGRHYGWRAGDPPLEDPLIRLIVEAGI